MSGSWLAQLARRRNIPIAHNNLSAVAFIILPPNISLKLSGDDIIAIEQLLMDESAENSYNYITDLLRMFPDFDADLEKTRDQSASKAGLDYDTLYRLSYPDLPFDVQDELTGPDQYTLRYHNGFMAPNDVAYSRFIDEVLTIGSGYPHWGSYETVPREVKRIK